jgi:tetratricopeptide (TPR) repeat protein
MIRLRLCVFFLWSVSWAWGQTGALLEKADAAFRAGDLEQAQSLAQKVLGQDPGAVHAHMILGVIAAQKKQWQASNRHFQAVIRLEPSNPYGYFYLGQANLYQQQWEEATRNFTKAQERAYPDRDRLAVELAMAQNEAGQPEQALKTLGAISPPVDRSSAAQYYAVVAFAQGNLNQRTLAIEAIRRALDLDGANVQYWDFLISTLIGVDQTPAALAEAIEAQKRFPDHADIQFLFGLASYYVVESPLTKLALRNLREVEPDGARVLLLEGMLYRKQGRTEDAVQAFRAAAKRGAPDAHVLLGILEREAGDREAAEREFREAERINPNNGQALLELGKLLLTRGELEQSRTRLEKAGEYMPASFAVHYQLGLLYRRLGDVQKAEHHLRLSRELEAEQARSSRQPK